MFKDERFRCSIETCDEEKLMPSQVLTVLSVSHMLAEDLQIEVMKVSVGEIFFSHFHISKNILIYCDLAYIYNFYNWEAIIIFFLLL